MAGTYQLAIIVNGEADGVVELGDDITAIGSSAQGAESSVRGFFDGINQGAGGVSNVAAQMAGLDTAIGSAAQAWNAGEVASQSFASALDANIDGINAVGRMLGQLSTAINDTTPAPVVDAFNQLNTAYGAHNAALQETFTDWNKVNAAMADIRTSVGTLDQALAQTGQAAGNAGQGIGALDQSLGTVNQATTHAAQGFAGFAQSLGTAVDGGVARVKSGIAGLEQVVSATAQPFAGLGQAIGSGLSTATQKVSGFAQSIGSSIGGGLSTAAQSVTGWAQSVGSSITSGLSSIPNQLANVGGQIKGFFTGLLSNAANIKAAFEIVTGIAGTIAGAFAPVFDYASQASKGVANFQATLGVTRTEAESLAKATEQVFSNNWYDSFAQAGEAVGMVRQQLGDLGTEGLAQVTSGVAAMSSTFNVEGGAIVNAVRAIRDNFPGTTEAQALDMITVGFQNGLNSSGDFLESITEYSTQFGNGGASASQFFSVMETGLGSGVLGTDKAADMFKEFVVRIQDGSTLTSQSLSMLGLNADKILSDLASGTIKPIDAFNMVQDALSKTDNQAVLMQAGVGLLGTQFEDLGASAAVGTNAMSTSFDNVGGAVDGLNVKFNSIGDIVETMKRQFIVAISPITKGILELANGAMPTVQAGFAALNGVISGGVDAAMTFASALSGNAEAFNALSPAIQTAVTVLQTIGSVFQDLASQAVAWGANIFNQVAAGMESAAGPIISAINSIGSVIAGLLMPGSPPAFLPELDTWGAGAMSAYMEGWAQGDFSVFNSISDSIKGALDGIAKASGDKGMNVASILLGSQDEIASAVNEVRQFGSVSEATFQSIIAAAGPAGPQISGLVDAYLDLQSATQDVAQAQQELNDVTSNYAAQLDPLNAQLKGIQSQKQQIQDQQRLIKLQEEAGSAAAGSAEQQIALLEIQELQTKMSIRGVEQERDVAVDAAKQKLDAAKQEQAQAKARVDQQKAMIDQQNKTNALIADQAKAMASVGGAVKAAGGAMAGAASATKPLADAVQGVNQTLGAARQSISDVRTNLATMGATIQSVVAPPMEWLRGAITGLMGAAAGIAVVLGAPVVWSALGTALGVVGTALAAVGSAIAFVLSPIGLLLIAAAVLGAAITTNFMGIGTLAQNLMGIFGQFGTVISTAFAAFQSGGLAAAISTFGSGLASIGAQLVAWGAQAGTVLLTIGQAFIAWITPLIPVALAQLQSWGAVIVTWIVTQGPILLTQFLTWGAALISWIAPYIPIALAALGGLIASVGGWIVAQVPALLAQFMAWGQALISWITPYIPIALAALGGLIVAVGGWIVAQVPPLLAQFMAWGQALIAWIAPMIPPALAALGGLIGSLLSWAGGQLGALLSAFGAWAAPLIAWIPGAITSFLAQWPAMLSGWLDTFASWAGPLLAQLATLGASIIAWVATQAGPLLAQLAVWGVQFVAWVAPMIPQVLAGLLGLVGAIVVFIAQTAGVILAKVVVWGAAMLGWVAKEVLPKLPGILDDIKKSINTWVSTAVDAVKASVKSIGTGIVDGIRDGVSSAWGKFTKWIGDQMAKIPAPIRDALGMHSPSRVMAQLVGLPIVQGIGAGFEQGLPKVASTIASGAKEIVRSATSALTGPPASSGDLLGGLSDFVAQFLATAQSFNMKAVRGAQGFADTVGKILAVIAPALDALGGLRDMVAPTHEDVNTFGAALAYVLGEMVLTAYSFSKKGIAAAAAFAESVGKILAPIGTAVDAFAKLGDLVVPTHGTVDRFRAALQYVLGEMITVTYSFGPKSIAAAATFAESVGKIMGLIGPAIDAFARLPDLVVPSYAAINQFGRVLTLVTRMMEVVAARFQQDSVKAAATFAESAGKILAIIGPGVEGLTKLAEFGGVPLRVFNLFGFALRQAVAVLIAVGVQFKAEVVSAAAVFAEGAGKTVGMIGGASESLTKLKDFVAPTQAALASFGTSLRAALQTLIQVMQGFTADAIAAAGKFGEGAGKAVAFIGNAVDGFTKLKDFVAPTMGAIGSFGITLRATLTTLMQVMAAFTVDAVAAAGKFGEGAGKAVSFIGNAVGSFVKLAEFTGVGQAAIDAFGVALRATLQNLIGVMNGFTADAIAAAGKFGDGAGKAVSFIGNAVGSFVKLKDFQNIPQEAILMFVDNLWRVFEELEQASENFTPAGYAAAKSLYEGIGESMSVIGKAVDGIAKLKDMTNIPQATVLLFVDNLWRVFEELEQASENFTPAGYAAAKSLSDGIGESMSVIGKAIDGFLKLKEFEAVPQKTILAFVDTLWRVFEELEQASENFTAAGYAAAKSLNDGIGTSMSVIGRAVESFAKLAEFTAPAPKAIGLFGQALRAVLTELNAVAGVFSADAVAITATFATNVNTIVSQLQGALQAFATLGDAKRMGGDVLKSFMASAQSLVAQMNAYLPPSATIIGQNTVIGLINGIVSQRGALITAMVNTVMAAVMAARQTLGIASPSKVFEQIGQYAGAGLQGGMAAMQPAIAATGAGLGISAVNATTSALRPSGGGTTNNNQRSVVIEAGAIVINGAGGNPRATADATIAEINKRLGMQGT